MCVRERDLGRSTSSGHNFHLIVEVEAADPQEYPEHQLVMRSPWLGDGVGLKKLGSGRLFTHSLLDVGAGSSSP